MVDPAENIQEINVVDEFLKEDTEQEVQEPIQPQETEEQAVQTEEVATEEVVTEEPEAEEAPAENNVVQLQAEDSQEEAALEAVEEQLQDEPVESTSEEFLQDSEEENSEIVNEVPAPSITTDEMSSSSERIDDTEILKQLKTHYEETTLLFDALERQVVDNNTLISNQKMYINKLEKELEKQKVNSEDLKNKLDVTFQKLSRAEKKLAIVKKELLD